MIEHQASARFWECYDQLPQKIRAVADKNFELLKADPNHPSIQLKPIGRIWSARVGRGYRALAVKQDDCFVWF